MRKLKYLAFIFTAPAALLGLLMLVLLSLGGMISGYGFNRTFTILAEEFTDACKYARVRLGMQRKRK